MKTTKRTLITLALMLIPIMAISARPIDDTIPAEMRYKDYYYTKWFDECPNYFPGGIVDSCFSRYYDFWNFYGDASVAKWEYARHRMRIKGLVAMVDRYLPPTVDTDTVIVKLPEYLYIYQLEGRHHTFLTDVEDGLDLRLLDSVRWDTAHARVMELRRGSDPSKTRYCYLYEAYFKSPVYVDSDFYIYGSTNSNVFTQPGSHIWAYAPSIYVDIMDWGSYTLNPKCDETKYEQWINDSLCKPQGGWVAVIDCILPELGWHTPWPDSPWGYYLPIVDQWDLEANPDDAQHGEVIGGGRYPDDTYDTIQAIPHNGYYFYTWNDGDTNNPRIIHLISDTSLTALFRSTPRYQVTVTSVDTTQGNTLGTGLYPANTTVTIAANPYHQYKFAQWTDGDTSNPRQIVVTCDTLFKAIFTVKNDYTVEAIADNPQYGTVYGGGIYMEGEQATLMVSTTPDGIFMGWADGEWQLPRAITVTSDTLLVAHLIGDTNHNASLTTATMQPVIITPNPAHDKIQLTHSLPIPLQLTIYDMQGKLLQQQAILHTTEQIQVGHLPSGEYIIELRHGDTKTHHRLIVK